jgi:Enoyl-CoA hydratase/isomerase
LKGANGHFCSGGDLGNIATIGLDNLGWRRRLQDLHDWLQKLVLLNKPVIAAVDGAAADAGFSMALVADFNTVAGDPLLDVGCWRVIETGCRCGCIFGWKKMYHQHPKLVFPNSSDTVGKRAFLEANNQSGF